MESSNKRSRTSEEDTNYIFPKDIDSFINKIRNDKKRSELAEKEQKLLDYEKKLQEREKNLLDREQKIIDNNKLLDDRDKKNNEYKKYLVNKKKKDDKYYKDKRNKYDDLKVYLLEWEMHLFRIQNYIFPPNVIKTDLCKNGPECIYYKQGNCNYAHYEGELRIPYKLLWCKKGSECRNSNCAYSHSLREWEQYYNYNNIREKYVPPPPQHTLYRPGPIIGSFGSTSGDNI